MNAYTDFIDTIVYMPNPNRSLDDKLPTSLDGNNAVAGRTAFLNERLNDENRAVCNSCHSIAPGMGSNLKLVVSARDIAIQEQPMKVPQLRGMYQKQLFNRTPGEQTIDGFGVGHDGTFDTFVNLFNNGQFPLLTGHLDILGNLAAFVTSFEPGMAPAVGFAITIRADNLNNPITQQIFTTLLQQAAVKNVDLIAKGTVQGVLRGLLFDAAAANFKVDKAGAPALTTLQLRQFIEAGDMITFMGVPPGSGLRMGIDRDMDGILDNDE